MLAPEVTPHINLETFWLPKADSTLAASVDWAWAVVMAICIAFFVLLMGMMFYFVIRYRRRTEFDVTSDVDHNFRLELAWTIIPLALVIGLFFVGFKGFLYASVPPAETYDIQVTAQKWTWSFQYPNGVVTSDLTVPQGRPIRLIMSSRDVIHSFYVPEFRVKRDVIPGLYTSVWFEAKEPTETALECAEYCGGAGDGSRTTGHSGMWSHVTVLSGPDFDNWLNKVEEENNKLTPAQLGAKLYEEKGCKGCHSLDGTKITGPTFKGLYMRQEQMSTGEMLQAEENYLRESILLSQAKLVMGYPGVMPVFQGQLSDKQVDALIAFIKEQK
jgi:cytochrome c oxidase subunit 2